MNAQLENRVTGSVRPCGVFRQYQITMQAGMNRREELAAWKEIRDHAEDMVDLMEKIVAREDATNWQI